MNEFIRLTQIRSDNIKIEPTPIVIVVRNIQYISPHHQGGTRIQVVGETIAVSECYDKITQAFETPNNMITITP